MGIPAFWASPFPKPLAIWVRVQGMPISLGFGKLGPQRGNAHFTVTPPLPFPQGKSSGNEVGVTRGITRGIGVGATSFPGFSPTRPSGQERALGTRLGVETLSVFNFLHIKLFSSAVFIWTKIYFRDNIFGPSCHVNHLCLSLPSHAHYTSRQVKQSKAIR